MCHGVEDITIKKSKNNLQEAILFSQHVGFEGQTRVVKHLYLISHLANPLLQLTACL